MRTLLSLGLTAALSFSSPPSQVEAYHGYDGDDHQASFNSLSAQGYRMIALSIYGRTGDPSYAAVWTKRAGPASAHPPLAR